MPVTLSAPSSTTLTSVSRLTQNAQLSALNTSNPSLVTSLLAAATTTIQRLTHRDLVSQDYTEYDSGGNYPYNKLFLKQFPVTAINRVATNPQTVLRVINSNTGLNQRATIATITGGIRLYVMQSGVASTINLLYATYPTLSTLAAAITAQGNGFSASIQGPYTLHPSVDLRTLQGAYTCFQGGADLEMFTEELNSSIASMGTDEDFDWGGTYGWRLNDEAGILYGRFPRGKLNVRIDYTAGFAVVPDDLQEACTQLVLDLYNSAQVNQMLKSGGLGPYRFELNAVTGAMSQKVKSICSRYIDHARMNLV